MLHGVAMDRSLWRHLVADLRSHYRCITPTLPLGGHRRPMRPDADLSLRGQVRLVAEFLERLGLSDVTLVGNDWGGAQLLVSERRTERVGRLVLCPCEAFDNYPPGLPGRNLELAGKLPGGLNALLQPLRLRPLRRLPLAFGWMSKRPVPDEIMDAWLRPLLTQRAIRRDLLKYVRSVPKKRELLQWADRVFVMCEKEEQHRTLLKMRFPDVDRPVVVLDIEDRWYRGDPELVRRMLKSLGRHLGQPRKAAEE